MRVRRTMRAGMAAVLLALAACGGGGGGEEQQPVPEGNPMVLISTPLGDIKVELFRDQAPITVQNFLTYAQSGYYDGTIFHRIIPRFMVQGGGLKADMRDKPGQNAPIKNESSNGLKNEVGTLAMARTQVPDSATSQFFINVADNRFLNRETAADKVGYAVFGKVISGMEVVKAIEAVPTTTRGMHENVPIDPVLINSIRLTN